MKSGLVNSEKANCFSGNIDGEKRKEKNKNKEVNTNKMSCMVILYILKLYAHY